MKILSTTFCLVGTALALSACGSTFDSGASYATQRTAGNTETVYVAPAAEPVQAERVFKTMQTK